MTGLRRAKSPPLANALSYDASSMPTGLDRDASLSVGRWKPVIELPDSNPSCIEIGLVNNMPSAALESTERQFRTLLDTAGAGMAVRLTLYALPNVPRTDAGQLYVSSRCFGIDDLSAAHLDGLIVTGTEPRAPNLNDEPYWSSFTKLADWAELHTHSTIWSCLAAHAAVLYIDGISRLPLRNKCCGVFECARASDHPLTAGLPARSYMPHSRWNEISEEALTACGYRILTRSENAGVDIFVKRNKSLFAFFQGHPEYAADTLLFEYRRDVGRFLRLQSDRYPSMPQGYFDQETIDLLHSLQEQALSERREELLLDFPTTLAASRVRNIWSPAALSFYRNWLFYLRAQKDRQLKAKLGSRNYSHAGVMNRASRERRTHRYGTL